MASFLKGCISFANIFLMFVLASQSTAQTLDCDSAYASPSVLWPPNHKFVDITIEGVPDADSVIVQCISQDESLNTNGDGNTEYDGQGVGTATASVRAERQGGGNGRVYHIDFLASNASGQCSGSVQVGVPPSKKKSVTDDGRQYVSVPDPIQCDGQTINKPPVILSAPIEQARVGESYVYDVEANDPENDPITYTLALFPEGLVIDTDTGLIQWLPSSDQEGLHPLEIVVADDQGNSTIQSFVVTVLQPVNHAPAIVSTPLAQALSNQLYTYAVVAEDPDGDTLTYSLDVSPSGMTIDASSGLISWTPTAVQNGEHSIIVRVEDGAGGFDTQNFVLTVPLSNANPVISSEPIPQAILNQPYAYPVIATDPDGDALTYSLVQSPAGMLIDAFSGLLTWTALVGQEGEHSIDILVEDGKGGSAHQTYTLSVIVPNSNPVIVSTPQSVATVNEAYIYNVIAEDVDGDTLGYEITTAPAGMQIDSATGILTWTPDKSQIGSHDVAVVVTDGQGGSDSQVYIVEVANTAPNIVSIPVWEARVGDTYQYQIMAQDIENHALTYTLEQGPAGMAVDGSSGQLDWTPSIDDLGVHLVSLKVSDSFGLLDTQQFNLTVFSQSNRAPQITSAPILSVNEGDSYVYDVQASDPDGDALSYSLEQAPSGMSISLMSGDIVWQPDAPAQLGGHAVTVRVQDIYGAYTSQNYLVNVIGRANQPPVIVSTEVTTGEVGELYTYDVNATDGDGDTLTYNLVVTPDTLVINPQTGLISGIPEQAGSVSVTVSVTDQRDMALQTYTLVIEEFQNNRAPVFTSMPITTVDEETLYAYDANANDLDGDSLAYSATQAPAGFNISPVSGAVSWLADAQYSQSIDALNSNCLLPSPVDGVFEPSLLWEWSSSTTFPNNVHVMGTPMVAQTTDDNLDGVIDQKDTPDIIFVGYEDQHTNGTGILRIISGDTGQDIAAATGLEQRLSNWSSVAVGDIDGDGLIEIVGLTYPGGVIAFEHDGTTKWINQDPAVAPDWSDGAPAIADLDGDGTVEIIYGRAVIDHLGQTEWIGTGNFIGNRAGDARQRAVSVASELGLTPGLEVIAGPSVYSADGTLLWQRDDLADGLVAIADLSQNGVADIVGVFDGEVYAFDNQGNTLWGPVAHPGGGWGGPPTVADMDGDGLPEIGISANTQYTVFNHDGSILWSSPTRDDSSATGSTVFDFENDGRAEVIYADETRLRVFDGITGAVLMEVVNSSGTAYEYPVVADVNNDGAAELVVPSNNYNFLLGRTTEPGINGIRVYGNAEGKWAATRSIWNQHAYHIDNINDDGTLPRNPEKSWQTHNTFRLNSFPDRNPSSLPDLRVGDIWYDTAANTLTAVIRNIGLLSVNSEVEINFYAGDPDQGGSLLGVGVINSLASGGESTVTIEVIANTIADDIVVRINELQTVEECQYENNQSRAALVNLAVKDPEGLSDKQSYLLNVHNVNEAPQITSVAENTNAIVGGTFEYAVVGNDEDLGDVLTYRLEGAPEGASIDAATGLMRWTPNASQTGVFSFGIVVTDLSGEEVSQALDLNVTLPQGNTAPVITSLPALSVAEKTHYVYDVEAEDVDVQDTLSYSRPNFGGNATIDSATGLYQWTVEDFFPAYSQGIHSACMASDSTSIPNLDTRNWTYLTQDPTLEGHSSFQTWDFNSDGTVAIARGNSVDSILMSDIEVSDALVEIRFHVEGGDDDSVGFAWGVEDIRHHYQFRFTKSDFGARVRIINTPEERSSFSHPTDVPLFADVDLRWETFVEYRALLDIRPGNTTIYLYQDKDLLRVIPIRDDTFTKGRFGFYARSQDDIHFSARVLPREPAADLVIANVELIDSNATNEVYSLSVINRGGLATTNPSTLNIRSYQYDNGAINEIDLGNQSIPVIPAGETEQLTLSVSRQDDGHDLRYFVVDPSGQELEECDQSNNDAWLPYIGVKVEDSAGEFDQQNYVLNIKDVNEPPVFNSAHEQYAVVGEAYQYNVIASDPDIGDYIRYELIEGPVGMQFHTGSGMLVWTPDISELYIPYDVTIRAVDLQGLFVEESFSVTLQHPPTISSSSVIIGRETQLYEYSVIASDPESDPLTYRLSFAPAGMSIDAATGVIEWNIPNGESGGFYHVIVQVDDGKGGVAEQAYTLAVLQVGETNAPPVITSTPGTSASVLSTYSSTVTASDADGDTLEYHLLEGPAAMQLAVKTGVLTWRPAVTQAAAYNVVVAVNDRRGGIATQQFTIDATGASGNAAPVISSSPLQTVLAEDDYVYVVEAVDPENETLNYQLPQAPVGMSIDTFGAITWRPTLSAVGSHPVTVWVVDAAQNRAEQQFSVSVVLPSNTAPQIQSSPVFQGYVNAVYHYQLVAVDDQADDIIYSLPQGPAGMSIDQGGLISWSPSSSDLGTHNVTVRVSDEHGFYTEQSYILDVTVRINNAPQISSAPVYGGQVENLYQYPLIASDPDGDALTYSLTLSPDGMSIDLNTGLIQWSPVNGDVGNHVVVVQVSDNNGGLAQQSYSLNIAAKGAPIITSVPGVTGVAGESYTYTILAHDPNGDALSYGLSQSPSGMSISNNVISWTPLSTQVGVVSVVVSVTDSGGLSTGQIYNLTITEPEGPNVAPQITGSLPAAAQVDQLYQANVPVSDPNGDPLNFNLVSGPAGLSVSSIGVISWTPTLDQVGGQPLSINIDDGEFGITLSAVINVDASVLPLDLTVNANPRSVQVDEPVTLIVTPRGGQGELSLSVTVDGESIALNNGQAVVSRSASGRYDVVAQVVDADTGETVMANTYFSVAHDGDNTAPEVTLESPIDGSEISAPRDIIATIQDDNLAHYELLLQRKGETEFVVIAEGDSNVASSGIAILDPSLLLNGQYTLILEATDTSGQSSVALTSVNIDGDLKVGNFSFTVLDLEIPLAGIPIRVTRTYDSRRKAESLDFGHGWSIDYQNVRVEESRDPGLYWALNEYAYGPLNLLTRYCVEPQGAPTVSVTLPDGSVENFDINASPRCNDLTPVLDVDLDFIPVGDTQSTLEAIGDASGRLNSGHIVETSTFSEPLNPNKYRLTTRAGFVYELDQSFGVNKITSPNGHTLTYTNDGIVHSGGKSVLFNRDAAGKITSISDPSGEQLNYLYSSIGDLVRATDQVQASTQYTYNRHHGLLDIIDPLGRGVLKNIYDDNGRLIAQEDANGIRTEFNHDIAGRFSLVTDRNGNNTQVFYNDRGDVTTQIDALGNTTTFTHDDRGNQLERVDALGNSQSATYNASNDQLSQTDELGNSITFAYNPRGQETALTDARSNVFANSYDSVGNLLTVTDPVGNVAGNNINAQGLVSSTVDVLGNITSFTYDSEGNKLTETDAEGNTTSFTYDSNNNILSESRARTLADSGVVTETTVFEYDARNRVILTTDALGNITRSEYDLVGNLVASIDALGQRTEMDYDAYGRLLETRYPDGTQENKTYDPEGNLLTETDRAGRTTSFTYDALNRQVRVTYPDATFSETEYDALGRVSAEVDELGNRTEYEYDAVGRRILTRNALLNEHQFEYDADGNLVAEVDALGHRTEYVYNALDQRVSSVFHNSSTMSEDFDALSRRTSQTDQASIVTNYAYDGLGRLTSVTDHDGNTTAYTYDEAGNKLTQTDAEGKTTDWAYDASGRVISRTLPLGQQETISYDANGNVSDRSDFNGQLTMYQYDTMNRLVRSDYADGRVEETTYDAVGNRTQALVTKPDLSTEITTYTYDSRDRLIKETQADGSVVDYQYDAVGNRTQAKTTDSAGGVKTIDYTFDALNRMLSTTDAEGLTSYGYDAVGNRASVSYPSGASEVYTYDSLNRLTKKEAFDGTGALIQSQDYALHATGRREQIDELSGRTTAYTYDNLYRLTDEVITDVLNGNYSANYQYDLVGNRTQSLIDGVTTAYTYDLNDRLLQQGGTTYTYDANGSTLTESEGGNTITYSYNAKNQLIERDDGLSATSYEYNLDGIRTQKTEGGVTTSYLVDSNRDYAQVLVEFVDGVESVSYTYGDDLISQTRAGETSYYHYDGLGSVRGLTSATGSLSDTYDYEAFGEVLNQTGSTVNSYMFTGEARDSESGHYYLRARYYDPNRPGFTQMDTFQGFGSDPRTLHKYLYANADPGNIIDPSGHFGIAGALHTISVAGSLATAGTVGFQFGSLLDRIARTGDVLTTQNATTLATIGAELLPLKYLQKIGDLAGVAAKLERLGFGSIIIAKDVKGFNKVFHWVQQMESRGFKVDEVVKAVQQGSFWVDTKSGAVIKSLGDARKNGTIKVLFTDGKITTVLKDKLTNKVVPFTPID